MVDQFIQWVVPRFNADSGKWVITVEADGEVLQVYEYDTEVEALAEYRRLFVEAVMSERRENDKD